jgi:nitrite reductase (NO-forming)
MTSENRRRHRVVASHRIAVTAFRLAGVFMVIAVGWSVWVLARGGSWWGPVHAFLLGTVTLAIAGASQMFTITWSAAPAPPAIVAATQRWSHAIGAVLVLVGVAGRFTGVAIVGGIAVVLGLVLLAGSLVGAVRHSLLRRFDLSARFYLLAIACALVGVSLGVLMEAGVAGALYVRFRVAHGHLNLVGFVGFSIIGTLPTILPTFARHRAVSGREAVWAWRVSVAAAAAMTGGLLLGERAVGVGTLLAGLALALVIGGVIVRLGRTGVRGGLPYLQVGLGCGWLLAWAVVEAWRLFGVQAAGAFDQWILAAVVAGVGQVLLGSLAYLLPVLSGPGPKLGRNFSRFDVHRWVPLAAANGAGIALLAGSASATAMLLVVWTLDFGLRLVRLERTPVPDGRV